LFDLFVVSAVFVLTVPEGSRFGISGIRQCRSLFFTQFPKPFFEEPPFRFQPRERQGALVGRTGLGSPVQPPAQIPPGRVREVVVGQLTARENGINQRQTGRRSIAHRYCHGAIQLYDRRRFSARQEAVKRDDLRLSGGFGRENNLDC
jgi:hypothetical protein